jgi:hypothetical protein
MMFVLSMNFCSLKTALAAAWRTGNYQAKILFENKDSQAKGETTVLQKRVHPSQQQFFEFLGTRKLKIVASVLSISHLHSQSVGAPTVHVLLDSSCYQYCNVTLNPVGMPS